MSPFLRAVLCWVFLLSLAAAGWTALAGGDGYEACLRMSMLGVLVGGLLADARRTRVDVALAGYLLGIGAAVVPGVLWIGPANPILGLTGALMGLWLFSGTPLSVMLVLTNLALTLGFGLAAQFVHPEWVVPLPRLGLACLGLVAVLGVGRRYLTAPGRPGPLHTLLVFACCLLLPLGAGLGPFPYVRGNVPFVLSDQVNALLALGLILFYHWSLRCRAEPAGPPAHPTCGGCAFLYFLTFPLAGVYAIGCLFHDAPMATRALVLGTGAVLTLALAYAAQRRVRR